MSRNERKAYREGQKAAIGTILAIVSWAGIIVAALIKAGIYVI